MEYFTPVRSCLIAAILIASQSANAQVVFDDGAAHTIPGDPAFTNGQDIVLENASELIVQVDATVVGVEDSNHQTTLGGNAVDAQAGTTITQQDGDITGGKGNTLGTPASGPTISAVGGAGVQTSGTYNGIGGLLTGGFGYAESETNVISSISLLVTATGGPALLLMDGAAATLSGVELNGGDADARLAESSNVAIGGAAVQLDDSGPVVISSGMFTGGAGSANALVINNATATGMGGPAIDVMGASTLTLDGGVFHGGLGAATVEILPAPGLAIGAPALRITGPANITINAGTFRAGSAIALTIPPQFPETESEGALQVAGDASLGDLQLTIHGGEFDGPGFALETIGTSPQALNARIDIYGGDFDNNFGDDISLSNPDILTTIYGSGFMVDGSPVAAGPVAELSGTLTGTLADGSTIEWQFDRSTDVALHLAGTCDTDNTDIAAFVAAVLTASTDPADLCMYDTNSDGMLDGLDVQGFVARLLGA